MQIDDLMTRQVWGLSQIAQWRNQPYSTIAVLARTKDFPDPDFILGTNIKAYMRTKIVAWFKAYDAKTRQ